MLKGNKIILTVYGINLVFLVTSFILAETILEGMLGNIFKFSALLSFSIMVIYFSVYIIKLNKKDNNNISIIVEYIDEQNYIEARQLINNCIDNESVVAVSLFKYKLALILLELRLGNNDIAKEIIFNTKWMGFNKDTLYHKALFSIKDNNIIEAKKYQEKLMKSNRKNAYSEQITNLNKIFEFLDSGNKEGIITKLPLVNEIINSEETI